MFQGGLVDWFRMFTGVSVVYYQRINADFPVSEENVNPPGSPGGFHFKRILRRDQGKPFEMLLKSLEKPLCLETPLKLP